MPQYLWERLNKVREEFGYSDERQNRKAFEYARWKEAVLNSDCDPMISEMPLTEALSKEVNNILKGWESFIDTEYVEDAIIDLLGRRTGGEEEKPSSESSATPELDSGAEMLYTKTFPII